MRVLATIPHYFNPQGGGDYGSVGTDPQPRIWALTQCLRMLRGLYDSPQELWRRQGDRLEPAAANQSTMAHVDIVVCTTGDFHVLDQIPFPGGLFQHHATQSDPLYLGYECHSVLRDRLGQYDFYCYMEDDLVLHDPYFFSKLTWFNGWAGPERVLQPNRFEFAYTDRQVKKVYIDFELKAEPAEEPLQATMLGQPLVLWRTSNPHAGSFFLGEQQMSHWAAQPYFLDRSDRYVGPLESAATLGLMRTFQVYKPAPENASFLEIQHYGQAWSRRLARVRIPTDVGE